MNHRDVIERLCHLQGEVAAHMNFRFAADCFCGESGFWQSPYYDPDTDYQNSGEALEFIERAVREKITREKASRHGRVPLEEEQDEPLS